MTQKDKTVINMGDPGLVHVQPEFQTAFKYASALFSDGFRLRFGAFDNKHEVIGIPTVRHSGLPLPVFPDRCTSTSLDTVVPVPAVLSGFPAQVAFMQILIELIQHDVRQSWRYYASLRHTFTGRLKETDVDVSCFDNFPQQGHEASITDPAADGFHQQALMYSIEVAGQITFNHPAPGFPCCQ